MKAHIFLSGRVQGVGMRFFVHSVAQEHSLSGFVRNLPDGRVESILEGPKHDLEKALEEIKNGEYANYIRHVECAWEDTANTYPDFQVLL